MRHSLQNAHRKRQNGVFAIELAFILTILCAIFLFTTDLSYQLIVRAKLDRSSFALANIVKERTRYFDGNVTQGTNLSVGSQELDDLTKVASRLLNITEEKVAIRIESLTSKTDTMVIENSEFIRLDCKLESIVEYAHLAPTEKGVIYPLYRVTLCQELESWFMPFLNYGTGESTKIVSSSIIPGR